MSTSSPPISLRLPDALLESLDEASRATRRSRSFLMQEALARHLADIVREQSRETRPGRLAAVLALAGAGKAAVRPRSAEDVDSHIRWLRDNG